ncbi:MAG TPA: ROK family protein [Micromonospora sp.]
MLRDDGPRSRVELGDLTELSRSRLTVELDRLTERGLVDTAGMAASRGGRRSPMVRVAPGLRLAGIVVGTRSVSAAVTDGELNVLSQVSEPIDARTGPDAVLGRVVELVDKLRAEVGESELAGAAVGLPGPVSFADGVPVASPDLPGWQRYPVGETLSAELGCPTQVDNDANLMALGERHAGVARPFDDFLFVKLGPAISCGIVLAGNLYRGSTGSAGDIGHLRVADDGPLCVCGATGCLETRLGDDAPTLATVRDGARQLGHALVGLVSFFNPGLVVIGGTGPGTGHALLAEIRGVVYRSSAPHATGNMPILLSELGGEAGLVGAARLASDHLFAAV